MKITKENKLRSMNSGVVASIGPKKYVVLAIAALVVLVIGFFAWEPLNDNLYEKYAATNMAVQLKGSSNSHADSVLLEAATAFNNKEYAVAAVDLAEVLQYQPDNQYAMLYLGISLMHTAQIPKARAVFEKLVRANSPFKNEATWYEALSYLKEKDNDNAKDWLEKVPADAPGHAKVQELMKKL